MTPTKTIGHVTSHFEYCTLESRPPEARHRLAFRDKGLLESFRMAQFVGVASGSRIPVTADDFNRTDDDASWKVAGLGFRPPPLLWIIRRFQRRIEVNASTDVGWPRSKLVPLRTPENELHIRLPNTDCSFDRVLHNGRPHEILCSSQVVRPASIASSARRRGGTNST
jgi:hypothetical protein